MGKCHDWWSMDAAVYGGSNPRSFERNDLLRDFIAIEEQAKILRFCFEQSCCLLGDTKIKLLLRTMFHRHENQIILRQNHAIHDDLEILLLRP